jgi:hypothetical protein
MNGWTDLQVNLSEPIVAHLIYLNPNFHSHTYFIQFDIHLFLKSIKNCKSQVVATRDHNTLSTWRLILSPVPTHQRSETFNITGPITCAFSTVL